jgi:hypothetical protein
MASVDASCIASPWHQWLCTYFGVALDCQWPVLEALYWNTRCIPVGDALLLDVLQLPASIPGWLNYQTAEFDNGLVWYDDPHAVLKVYMPLERALEMYLDIDETQTYYCTVRHEGYVTLKRYLNGRRLSKHRAPLAQGLGQLERVVRHFGSLV